MKIFYLNTKNTTYVLGIHDTGKVEHLYYGKHITQDISGTALVEPQVLECPHSIIYDENVGKMTLDNMGLEYSEVGKGDFREPALEIYSEEMGYLSDFTYVGCREYKGKKQLENLPSASGDETHCNTLEIDLYDKNLKATLTLCYHVFYECDVITRNAKITNHHQKPLVLNRIMSLQLDLEDVGYSLVSFDGEWAREMTKHERALVNGSYMIDSKVGVSSNKHNPFIILKQNRCTETFGDCYGFNLIYSGNHAEIIEVSSYDKIRVLSGINPHCFSFHLATGQSFVSPEAVMTFSSTGLNGMSQNMHHFIKKHIIPKRFQNKERPVLINNWEATYFDFNKEKLLGLAKEAAALGIELFVLDDGWFGKRNDDTSSLGDWFVNTKKLEGGLDSLAEEIKQLGMTFGLWIEPEMISEKSKLYTDHPEWIIGKPNTRLSKGRNQLILDLTRQEVCDYLVDTLSSVLSSADITYVKWDMNRNFADMYSENLGKEKQGELFHRYIVGFYDVLNRLTVAFPNILFEGCAAGGNRFDLGILCYMPQIWASDDTDAYERLTIQNGISYGYPPSTFGAHVSACPNHQTLRYTSLETRFNVAAFGLLGYELNLLALTPIEKETIKNQIAFYKKYRKLMQFGEFYRFDTIENKQLWLAMSEDKTQGMLGFYQTLARPNPTKERIKMGYLEDRYYYSVETRPQWVQESDFGHVSEQMDFREIEKEFIMAWGDLLNYAGFRPKEQFCGGSLGPNVRVLGDFGSRLYKIEKVDTQVK